MSSVRLAIVLCLAEILGLAGFATFPALVPVLEQEWALHNTAIGWISGVYYAGYLLAVPILTGLTDHVDARRVWLGSAALVAASLAGFAGLAEGVATASLFRALAGMGLAGMYMPGLKILTDRTRGPLQSRFVAFYTSSFGAGASLSYYLAGVVEDALGWRWAFGLAAAMTLAAIALVFAAVPAAPPRDRPRRRPLDFGPVLRHGPTMAYVVGYAAHAWELFAFRAWIVAFMAFAAGLRPSGSLGLAPTTIAALVNLLGPPASIGGNELARRFGRRGWIAAVMAASFGTSCFVGLAAGSTALLVALVVAYGLVVMADSAALTAGLVATAPPDRRGAALAVYSWLGFGAGFLAPLAVGLVLDAAADGSTGWALAFPVMGAGNLLGLAALRGTGTHFKS